MIRQKEVVYTSTVITARTELRKVLFLALSVSFSFIIFYLWIKYLRNRWTDLRQIHSKYVCKPSLGRVWMSMSKVKGQGHQGQKRAENSHYPRQRRNGPICCMQRVTMHCQRGTCVRFMFGKTYLALVFCLFVYEISRKPLNGFATNSHWKTCLVPRWDDFECQGERSKVKVTKDKFPSLWKCIVTRWLQMTSRSNRRDHSVAAGGDGSAQTARAKCDLRCGLRAAYVW